MNVKELAKRIREHARNPKSVYVAPQKPKKHTISRMYPLGPASCHQCPEWVKEGDVKPKLTPKPDRRRKGQPALERIAAHYPVRKE